MRPNRAGRLLYPGDSGAHRPSVSPRPSPAASQRLVPVTPAAQPSPGCLCNEASAKVSWQSPYRSSPHLWPPWLEQRPLGFSVSSAPDRSRTGHARHGGDRSNTTCSYVSSISRTSSTSSLTTRDLVSQDPPQSALAAPLSVRRRAAEATTRASRSRPRPHPKTRLSRLPDQRISPVRMTWSRFLAPTPS